jgi:AcrR family transcriptional regulator
MRRTRSTHPRTLSTAEERRAAVLEAAVKAFADRGLYGTPTMDIAKAAGISQAYLFRLFPTKTELFVALCERSCERIESTFAAAAARAKAKGSSPLRAMGEAYAGLLDDRDLLLSQLHMHAAAQEPEVREAVRRGWERLVEVVIRESGARPEEVKRFFADGMLLNVVAAIEAPAVDEPWARVLVGRRDED